MIGYEALHAAGAAYAGTRDVVVAEGPGTADYLQGQVSQDLAGLEAGQGVDALVLEPDGKLVSAVRVARFGEDVYWVDVESGFGEALLARLERFRLRTKTTLTCVPMSWVAVRGPMATAYAGLRPPDAVVLSTDASGWQGLDLVGAVSGATLGGDVPWCDAEAFEARRIERGVPAMGAELDERTIAAEAGLTEGSVSFTKGCYTGQELIARLDARGNNVARRLRGIVLEGQADPDGLVGATLHAPGEERPLGSWTSAARSGVLAAVIGLGYVHRSVTVPGALEAEVDGARLAASVRALPLA
jgi:tRNA-modifying protein YgfZ